MMKKLIFILVLFSAAQLSYALSCPTVAEIKNQSVKGWQLVDSDNNKPLSPARSMVFMQNLDQFSLVEWQKTSPRTGAIHCYYRDKDGSALEAYLIKNNVMPDNAGKFWYQVSGAMECAAGMENCRFTPSKEAPQLANK